MVLPFLQGSNTMENWWPSCYRKMMCPKDSPSQKLFLLYDWHLLPQVVRSLSPLPGYWSGNGIAQDDSSAQLLSFVWLFATPRTAECQAFLSITNSQSLLKLRSIKLVMPSNHLILCHSLFPLPSILSHHQSLFQWVSSSHQVAKVLELQLQHQSFQWIFSTDFL